MISNNKSILWITPDNVYGGGDLKQHGFRPDSSRGEDDLNVSLCGKIKLGNEDENIAYFYQLEKEYREGGLDEIRACKHCLKIFNKRN